MKDLTHLDSLNNLRDRAANRGDIKAFTQLSKEIKNELNYLDGELSDEFKSLTDDELLAGLI